MCFNSCKCLLTSARGFGCGLLGGFGCGLLGGFGCGLLGGFGCSGGFGCPGGFGLFVVVCEHSVVVCGGLGL